MNKAKPYIAEFCKTAGYYGYSATELIKLVDTMQKKAGYGSLARVIAKMSPKVDPKKLNWFTKLFTTSHKALAKSNPVPKSFRLNTIKSGPESAAALGTTVGYGSVLPPVLRNVTKVSPLKVLAGLAAAGAGTRMAISSGKGGSKPLNANATKDGKSPNNSSLVDYVKNLDPELKKKILIGLGAGAAGAAGIGILSSVLGSKK